MEISRIRTIRWRQGEILTVSLPSSTRLRGVKVAAVCLQTRALDVLLTGALTLAAVPLSAGTAERLTTLLLASGARSARARVAAMVSGDLLDGPRTSAVHLAGVLGRVEGTRVVDVLALSFLLWVRGGVGFRVPDVGLGGLEARVAGGRGLLGCWALWLRCGPSSNSGVASSMGSRSVGGVGGGRYTGGGCASSVYPCGGPRGRRFSGGCPAEGCLSSRGLGLCNTRRLWKRKTVSRVRFS